MENRKNTKAMKKAKTDDEEKADFNKKGFWVCFVLIAGLFRGEL